MQKLKPLYEIRTRVSTQFALAKKNGDTDTIKIWERVWKAVTDEIVALHDETYEINDKEKLMKS